MRNVGTALSQRLSCRRLLRGSLQLVAADPGGQAVILPLPPEHRPTGTSPWCTDPPCLVVGAQALVGLHTVQPQEVRPAPTCRGRCPVEDDGAESGRPPARPAGRGAAGQPIHTARFRRPRPSACRIAPPSCAAERASTVSGPPKTTPGELGDQRYAGRARAQRETRSAGTSPCLRGGRPCAPPPAPGKGCQQTRVPTAPVPASFRRAVQDRAATVRLPRAPRAVSGPTSTAGSAAGIRQSPPPALSPSGWHPHWPGPVSRRANQAGTAAGTAPWSPAAPTADPTTVRCPGADHPRSTPRLTPGARAVQGATLQAKQRP